MRWKRLLLRRCRLPLCRLVLVGVQGVGVAGPEDGDGPHRGRAEAQHERLARYTLVKRAATGAPELRGGGAGASHPRDG